MLFVAYALFLVLIICASASIRAGRTPRREGSPWRPVTLTLSIVVLLLMISLAPNQEGFDLGTLLVATGILGSTLYAVGAASWTGTVAFRLRQAGWVLIAIAFGFPSTLSLALPVLGVLAFTLAPISPYATRDELGRASA